MSCERKVLKVAEAQARLDALALQIDGMERESAEEEVADVTARLVQAKNLCDDCGEYPAQFSSITPMRCTACFLSEADRKLAENVASLLLR